MFLCVMVCCAMFFTRLSYFPGKGESAWESLQKSGNLAILDGKQLAPEKGIKACKNFRRGKEKDGELRYAHVIQMNDNNRACGASYEKGSRSRFFFEGLLLEGLMGCLLKQQSMWRYSIAWELEKYLAQQKTFCKFQTFGKLFF